MEFSREEAGKQLRGFILDNGKTQFEIHKGSGISENTISKIVNDKVKPDALTCEKLTKYSETIGK